MGRWLSIELQIASQRSYFVIRFEGFSLYFFKRRSYVLFYNDMEMEENSRNDVFLYKYAQG